MTGFQTSSRFSFSLTLSLTAALVLFASPSRSFATDLSTVYRLALENDVAYQIAKLEHDVKQIELPLAETAFKPGVSASAVLGRSRGNSTGVATTEPGNRVGMDVNLTLYDKGIQLGVKQTSLQIESSALALADAKHDLILRVANRYFSLLAAMDQREVARVQKAAIQRQMDLASERLDVGLGTRTDLFDAKARFQQAQADEIQAENLINNNIAVLREMIGTDPGEIAPLAEDAPLALPSPNNVESWIEQAMDNSISIKSQAVSLQSAKIEIEKNGSLKTPRVGLNASHNWTEAGSGGFTNKSSTTSVALQFSIPIYSGGSVELKKEKAAVQYELSSQLLEQTKRQISTATISEFLAVNSRLNQANALLEAIVAGENALEAKEEGFSAGLTTNLDVLDAQRDLSRSRSSYLQARYDYIISTLNLERVTGQLDEDDILRVNNWLVGSSTGFNIDMSPAYVDTIPENSAGLIMESYAMNF